MRATNEVDVESAAASVEQLMAQKREEQRLTAVFDPAYLAEFLGTLLLVLFGDGAVAQVTFNKVAVGSSHLSVALGFAFGLTCALFVAGPVSGGHLNPAITVANALFRKFPWRRVPGYIFAQTFGAFMGASLVYLVYWPAMNVFDGGVRQTLGKMGTGGIFATYPNPAAPNYSSFLTEVVISGVFVVCIVAMTDPRHRIPGYVSAIAIGLSIGVVGLSLGVMTGFALNPARDFGPRFFTSIAGWGWEPFQACNYYFWVPIVGPTVGAILGTFSYDLLIFPNKEI
ncbi:glycerol channel [Entomophthora muscae]|uniref:Glycerol channel n=1 Tax=Entomophthora muscae TaxID=34485 RepID=A0ACC2TP60_9FUNG|nr:glycerol channel [Entomophthora muscae]